MLDGYAARTYGQQSSFGRMLDPIADKLLVASCLLMLAAEETIRGWTVWAAIVILCREILVSGLREYLAELRVSVPVTKLAKWKTTVQLVAIGFLLAGPASGYLSDHFGARPFATGGMVVAAISFILLEQLPVNFSYLPFALLLFLNGAGMGLFASPNRAGVMNSLPPSQRGAGGCASNG